jgi:hypothetical protein
MKVKPGSRTKAIVFTLNVTIIILFELERVAKNAQSSLLFGQKDVFMVAGVRRMTAGADQAPACLGINEIPAHGVHMRLIGIVALQAHLNLVAFDQQLGIV